MTRQWYVYLSGACRAAAMMWRTTQSADCRPGVVQKLQAPCVAGTPGTRPLCCDADVPGAPRRRQSAARRPRRKTAAVLCAYKINDVCIVTDARRITSDLRTLAAPPGWRWLFWRSELHTLQSGIANCRPNYW